MSAIEWQRSCKQESENDVLQVVQLVNDLNLKEWYFVCYNRSHRN